MILNDSYFDNKQQTQIKPKPFPHEHCCKQLTGELMNGDCQDRPEGKYTKGFG